MKTPDPAARRRAYRWSYVLLALLCILASAGSVAWCAHITDTQAAQQRQTIRNLCGVIAPFAATPVPRPDPSHPARAAQYAWHQKFITLDRQFHC